MQYVFWPVLNHGDPSLYASVTAECVARQDMEAFWRVHRLLFEEQRQLWSADRDYFVDAAVRAGADQAAFEQCYDDGSGVDQVLILDTIRRERGIYGQPVFDINGQILFGGQSWATFQSVIDPLLP